MSASAPPRPASSGPAAEPTGSTSAGSGARLSGRLGPIAIIFMVVAAASPLTVVGGATPLGIGLGNGAGYPFLFLPITVVLLLFAGGLNAMTQVVEEPGAFYTYIDTGLGRRAGAAAAWLALLCYTTVQLAVHAYVGFLLARGIEQLGGPHLPWWLCTAVVIAAVGFLGYRHIDLSSKVLGVLLVCEILVVLALTVAVAVTGGADGITAAPFTPSSIMSGAPGVGLLFAIGAFIGFEATAIYRDEARDPERTIPRATYGALIGIGIFYAVGSAAMVYAWGPAKVVEVAMSDPGNLLQATMRIYFGAAGPAVVDTLILTSMFACVLSFHNVISRYQLSMATTGLLPSFLADVHDRHASPSRSSLVQTATALVLLAITAGVGLDPVMQIFSWFSGVAVLAALLLMLATSVAVVVFFRTAHHGAHVTPSRWSTRIAPVLGGAGLLAMLAIVVANFPTLVGDVDASGAPTFGPVSIGLIGSCVIAIAIGLFQATATRRHRSAARDRATAPASAPIDPALTTAGESHV